MSDRGHQLLYHAAHAAARRAGALADADLVRQLAQVSDRAAFELLLWRHGPAVWAVCRRVLGPGPDAEDAFQATFLALSRRASTISDGNAVAGWLHRVAVRAAVETAKARSRRTSRETPSPILPEAIAPDDPVRVAAGRELGAMLDAAIARLPDRYRQPFLLCEVYGRAPADAAAELNCPVGTIASRLSRAKRRLRAVLARRGLALPATLAVGVLPTGLATAALRTAFAPVAGAKLAALADRAIRPALINMWMVVAAAGLVAVTAGVLARGQVKTPPADKPPPAAAKKADTKIGPVTDWPRPDGAVARIGSTRLRHAGAVNDVAFSPDNKWVATACSVGAYAEVFVWDTTTGEKRLKLPGNPNSHLKLMFADGDKALWIFNLTTGPGSPRTSLRRYSLADGHELPEILPLAEQDGLLAFAFDPAGKRFGFTRGNNNSSFRVIEVATGKTVNTFPTPAGLLGDTAGWPSWPAFAPGGKLIAFPPGAAHRGPGTTMPVIDVDTGKELTSVTDADYAIGMAAFAPDGKTVAATGIKGWPDEPTYTVTLWDVKTGKLLRRMSGVEQTEKCLAFSPDGKYLAVGDTQRLAVQLFDVATGKEVRRFQSSPGVMQVAFSPDGKRLAAARSSDTVSIWDVETGKPTAASADPEISPMELRFVDRDRLLIRTDGFAVFDWRTGKVLERSALLPEAASYYTLVSPDRRMIAMRDYRGPIRLCDAATGAELKKLEGHTNQTGWIVFSPDSARLYSYDDDPASIRAWDVGTGKELFKADFSHASVVERLAVASDRKWLATSAYDNGEHQPIVQVWDAATGKAGFRFVPPKGPVLRLAFSPDGTTLAATGGEEWHSPPKPGWLVLWDLTTGNVRRALTTPTGVLFTLAFTPDRRSIITGGSDGVVRVWELATGQERRAMKGHQRWVHHLTVSPDSRHIASTSPDEPTLVWDLYGPTGGAITEADGKQLVTDLAGDPAIAFTAISRLAAHATESVPLIQAHLKPAAATDPKRIAALVKALDADRFAAREQAAADLTKLGDEADPALRAALAGAPSAEARERLTQLLPKVAAPTVVRLRELRAVEALEVAGTPEAAALLAGWAKDPTLRIRADAAAAHERMGRR
jgi:RNA polymerase sigma factor (sigma-70 family)